MDTNIVKTEIVLTPRQIAVLEAFADHRGYENRISRTDLRELVAEKTNAPVNDRGLREAIEHLRRWHPQGGYICSTTSGGYWMAKSDRELEAFLNQERDRALKIWKRVRQQAKSAGLELSGNVRLVEVQG